MVSGLEGLRSLVHENFLPAIDRCTIILSRLRGLAQFHDSRSDIGIGVTQITRLMDIMSSLSLIGHKILIHTMDELESFVAFSSWLRFTIDRLAASSTASDELTEREATIDNPKVLMYIQHFLTNSLLDGFFNDVSKEDYTADWNQVEDGAGLLDLLDKQLKRREQDLVSMKALPQTDFMVNYAITCSSRIFESVAEAKKRSVRFGAAIGLSINHPITKVDVKMSQGLQKVRYSISSCYHIDPLIKLTKRGASRLWYCHRRKPHRQVDFFYFRIAPVLTLVSLSLPNNARYNKWD